MWCDGSRDGEASSVCARRLFESNESIEALKMHRVRIFFEQWSESHDDDINATTCIEQQHKRSECSNKEHNSTPSSITFISPPTFTNNMCDDDANNGDDDDVCPICLSSSNAADDDDEDGVEFVFGNCRHQFCLPCLQQVFAAPHHYSNYNNNYNDDNWNTNNNYYDNNGRFYIPSQDDILNVPTMGRCPVCRTTLCLLDLKKRKSKTDSNSNSSTEDAAESAAAAEEAVPVENDITKTDLAGLIFVQRRRKEGQESIHFPSSV